MRFISIPFIFSVVSTYMCFTANVLYLDGYTTNVSKTVSAKTCECIIQLKSEQNVDPKSRNGRDGSCRKIYASHEHLTGQRCSIYFHFLRFINVARTLDSGHCETENISVFFLN